MLKNKLTRTVFYSYISIVGIFGLIRMLSSFHLLNLPTVWDYLLNAFIQIGLMFALPVTMLSLRHKQKPKETFKFFGYKKISFKVVMIAFGMGVLVYILNIFVSNFFYNLLEALGYKINSSSSGSYPLWLLFVNLLCTAVLPAICEETTHRGLLLKGLSPFGRNKAIIISSMLFGLTHMNIGQFFYATLIGLLLGYVSSISDNIYPAMIIHFMNNALSTIMAYSNKNGLNLHFIQKFLNANLSTRPALAIIVSLVIIILAVLLLWILIKMLFKETVQKRTASLQEEIYKDITKTQYLMDLQQVSEGNLNLPNKREVSFDEFDEIYKRKGLELGYFTKLECELIFNDEKYKPDKVTMALMITCFVLSSAITLFTLIWGIFF